MFKTVKEVAQILRLNVDTIQKMCRKRDLKAVKIGRDWRIWEKDLGDKLNGK